MIVAYSFSQTLQTHTDSVLIPIRNIRIANKAFTELIFIRRIDTLQRQELIAKRLETNNLRWEVSKLKQNDTILNSKVSLLYKRQELDSNRILDLKYQIKQQKKDKILTYVVAVPVSFLVGTLVGILVKTFAIR